MTYGLVLLARSGSSRLPGKSLLPVEGRPVVAHQLARLKEATRTQRIVLATTVLPEDDALCAVAEAEGVDVFRGSPHDVLRRMGDAVSYFGIDFAVVVGGDDVFCDGEFVDAVVVEQERTGADFVTMEGVPFGTAPLGVLSAALRRALALRADESSDGWERFFTDLGLFRTHTFIPTDPALHHPEVRLDLDYPEDYELVKAVYARLFDGGVPPLRSVVRLLTEEEPHLADINRTA